MRFRLGSLHYVPQPKVQPPSRYEYLENFKQSQTKLKEAELRLLQENLENIATATHGSTSPVIDLLETSNNQQDQMNTSGTNNQASGSTTTAQIHAENPINKLITYKHQLYIEERI